MGEILKRYGGTLTIAILGLTAFWLLALVIFPYFILFEYSFRPYLPVTELGGPLDHYTLSNYATFFASPIHLDIFFKTVLFSSLVTFICLITAYPLAYFLAKVAAPRNAPTLFMILLIP